LNDINGGRGLIYPMLNSPNYIQVVDTNSFKIAENDSTASNNED